MNIDKTKYINQKEAAKKIGIHPKTLWFWRENGIIEGRELGREVFYRIEDINKILEVF